MRIYAVRLFFQVPSASTTIPQQLLRTKGGAPIVWMVTTFAGEKYEYFGTHTYRRSPAMLQRLWTDPQDHRKKNKSARCWVPPLRRSPSKPACSFGSNVDSTFFMAGDTRTRSIMHYFSRQDRNRVPGWGLRGCTRVPGRVPGCPDGFRVPGDPYPLASIAGVASSRTGYIQLTCYSRHL